MRYKFPNGFLIAFENAATPEMCEHEKCHKELKTIIENGVEMLREEHPVASQMDLELANFVMNITAPFNNPLTLIAIGTDKHARDKYLTVIHYSLMRLMEVSREIARDEWDRDRRAINNTNFFA